MKVILRILKHRFENYKLNPIQDGSFRDCSWMDGVKKVPLPKICHTCPARMKLDTVIPYPKRLQKLYE